MQNFLLAVCYDNSHYCDVTSFEDIISLAVYYVVRLTKTYNSQMLRIV